MGVVEEDAGLPLHDGIEEPAPPQDGRGSAKAGCLERRQAEVLVGSGDERGAVLVEPAEPLVGYGAEQGDVRTGERAEGRLVWAAPDHHQPLVPKLGEGLDDGVQILVGEKSGDAEDEPRVDALKRLCPSCGTKGWVRGQHFGFEPVKLPDSVCDHRRVGEVVGGPGGSPPIPAFESGP